MKIPIKYVIEREVALTLEEIRATSDGDSPLGKACKEWLARREEHWCEWPEGTIFKDNSGIVFIRTKGNQLLCLHTNGSYAIEHTDTKKYASPKYCTLIYYP